MSETKAVNINVAVRCRPLNKLELTKTNNQIKLHDQHMIEIQPKSQTHLQNLQSKCYQFDNVYDQDISQQQFYESAVSPVLKDFLQGYNCSVFTYGQTGSGKSYTMYGPDSYLDGIKFTNPKQSDFLTDLPLLGAIPRVIDELFRELNKNQVDFQLRASNVEVYNEDIYDLLVENQQFREPLKIYEERAQTTGNQQQSQNQSRNKVLIQNITEQLVKSPQEIIQLLQKSNQNRKIAETKMNEHSSRSHSIFTIQLIQKHIEINQLSNQEIEFIKISKLNLVDLAGSESIAKSGVDSKSERQQEASKINKSLLTLGRVINSLVENQSFIPYRDSKLTRLLSDSLGGRTKTCIIATISLSDFNVEETTNTLEYMTRAKKIKNMPEITQKVNSKTVLKEYSVELKRLQQLLEMQKEEKGGIFISNDEYADYQSFVEQKNEKVRELEALVANQIQEMCRIQELFDSTAQKYSIVKGELTNAVQVYKQQITNQNLLRDKLQLERDTLYQNRLNFESMRDATMNQLNSVFSTINVMQQKEDFQQQLIVVKQQLDNYSNYLIQQQHVCSSKLQEELKQLTTRVNADINTQIQPEITVSEEQVKHFYNLVSEFQLIEQQGSENLKQRISQFVNQVIKEQLQDAQKSILQNHENQIDDLNKFSTNFNSQIFEWRNFAGRVFDVYQEIVDIQTLYFQNVLQEKFQNLVKEQEVMTNKQHAELIQQINSIVEQQKNKQNQQLQMNFQQLKSDINQKNLLINQKNKQICQEYTQFNEKQIKNEEIFIDNVEKSKTSTNKHVSDLRQQLVEIGNQSDIFNKQHVIKHVQELIELPMQQFSEAHNKQTREIIQRLELIRQKTKQVINEQLVNSQAVINKGQAENLSQFQSNFKKQFIKDAGNQQYVELNKVEQDVDDLIKRLQQQQSSAQSTLNTFVVTSSTDFTTASQAAIQTPIVLKSPLVAPVAFPDNLQQSQVIYGVRDQAFEQQLIQTPTIK